MLNILLNINLRNVPHLHFGLLKMRTFSPAAYHTVINYKPVSDVVWSFGDFTQMVYTLNILLNIKLRPLVATHCGLGGPVWQPWIWVDPNQGLYSLNQESARSNQYIFMILACLTYICKYSTFYIYFVTRQTSYGILFNFPI